MLYRLLTALGLFAAAVPAAAEPVQLSSEAIQTTLAGSLVEMNTPAGTTIPVRFGNNGLVSGEAGVLAPVLGAQRDRGRWWVEGDRLCMKWFRWFEAERRCVTLHMDGEHLYWRGEDRSGTARIVERAPVVVASAPKPDASAEQVPAQRKPTADKPAQEEPAQVVTAEVEKVAITSVEPAPAPAAPATVETAQQPERAPAKDRAAKLALRFAAASLGGMTFAPWARETDKPQHLLAAPEREAIDAKAKVPERAPIGAQAAPRPDANVAEPKVVASKIDTSKSSTAAAQRPVRKAPEIATTHASSTLIQASFRVAHVDADDRLNVRNGPAIYYPSVGELPPEGRGVKIVGPCRLDWCPIRHGKMTGWVNRYFLAEDGAGPATAAVTR